MSRIAELLAKHKSLEQAEKPEFDDTIKDPVFMVWLCQQGIEFASDEYLELMARPAQHLRDQIIEEWGNDRI